MTSLKEILECPRCGCLVLPDAVKCPKCGTFYGDDGAESRLELADYPAKPRITNNNVEVVTAHYQFNCARHGRVNVKSAVIAARIKCPFCW